MQNQPGFSKDNPATRMFEEVKRLNAERGYAAGRQVGTGLTTGPTVRVSTAAMLEPIVPLSPAEQADRDAKAIALGVIEAPTEEKGNYSSFEEAAAAGGKPMVSPVVGKSIEVITYDDTRQTAREFLGGKPRLIDFKKVQYIDLNTGKAYVDGFPIELPVEHVKDIKKYIIELAVNYVTSQLAMALAELMPAPEATPDEQPMFPIDKASEI